MSWCEALQKRVKTSRSKQITQTNGFGTEGVSPDRLKASGSRSGGRNKTHLPHRERLAICVGKPAALMLAQGGV
jgi:hypothetical protein